MPAVKHQAGFSRTPPFASTRSWDPDARVDGAESLDYVPLNDDIVPAWE